MKLYFGKLQVLFYIYRWLDGRKHTYNTDYWILLYFSASVWAVVSELTENHDCINNKSHLVSIKIYIYQYINIIDLLTHFTSIYMIKRIQTCIDEEQSNFLSNNLQYELLSYNADMSWYIDILFSYRAIPYV